MSLLNDALRKNRAEQGPQDHGKAKTFFTGIMVRRRQKGYALAAAGLSLLMAITAVAWWAWPDGHTSFAPTMERPVAGPADALPAANEPLAATAPESAAQVLPLTDEGGTSAPDEPLAPQIATFDVQAPARSSTVRDMAKVEIPFEEGASSPHPDPLPKGRGSADPVFGGSLANSASLSPAPPGNNAQPKLASVAHKPPARQAKVSPQATLAVDSKADRQAAPANAAKPEDTVTAFPPTRTQQTSVTRLYEKGRAYHRQGQMPEAIGMYREVLKIDPDHFDASFNLSSAYLETEAFSKAFDMAADLYRKAPDNPRVALNLAIAQIGCGRPRQGLELLDKADKDPQAPLYEIYFHKGVAYRYLDQPEQAVTWYQKAEQLKPNDPRLLFNLALALDQRQHYDAAVKYYLKYLHESKNLDRSTRAKIDQRIHALRADMAAHPNEEEEAQ